MSLIFFYLLQLSQILEIDLSVLVVCSSVTSSLAAEHFVQQRTEEKSTEPGPCLARVTLLDDLLSLM